jgi:16S rRNA (uracil1498-N3)-methyltransferase
MASIFLPEINPSDGTATITGEKARYLTTVLRCREGDFLTIRDGRENSYSARIKTASHKGIVVELVERKIVSAESPLRTTILQGILKGEKMDFVVRKATELGVSEIVPVITERSQIRSTRKVERWRKIAEEASRQSGRTTIQPVREVIDVDSLFDGPPSRDIRGVLFWEREGMRMTDALDRLRGSAAVTLFIGPEGGFSEREARAASDHGLLVASLGRRILRAETAAVAALSIIQYALGDLGSE